MIDDQIPIEIPEKMGIPSGAILQMIDHLEQRQINMHSLLVLRNGVLVSEHYWQPYTKDDTHRMYSASKSFVSVAVGLMIDKKLLVLDDTIASFFPGELPDHPHPWLLKTTVRDFLMMADCHEKNTYVFSDTNWRRTWFNTKPDHLPGTIFNYSTICTNILTAIVEKISGTNLLDFMRPGILDPIGFSKTAWCIKNPEGTSFGGSGICCTSRDLARFGLLCLNKGEWQGRQLISRAYMDEATSFQIPTVFANPYVEQRQGYGYQFWMTRHNGFACAGMGGQLAICLPEKDLLVVTTGDSMGLASDVDEIIRAVFEVLYPRLSSTSLEVNREISGRLEERSKNLSVLPMAGSADSPIKKELSKKRFHLESNVLNISCIQFIFENDQGKMVYEKHGESHEINFGFGTLIEGNFPEKIYSGSQIGKAKNKGYRIYSSAAWAGTKTLLIMVYVMDDYLATLKITVSFPENEISLRMVNTAEAFLDDYSGFAAGTSIQ
ncbi:beta-lactamase family protein [Treponema sp. OttesenSCG-928-L16]|nr:beta-lactamase family protein [Treponema sp. OttesenSCG-928-L16]